jgi:hypothetical protein
MIKQGERFCYKSYGLDDCTCYLPKNHPGECGPSRPRPTPDAPNPSTRSPKEGEPRRIMLGCEAMGNGNDHFGVHDENNFCQRRECISLEGFALKHWKGRHGGSGDKVWIIDDILELLAAQPHSQPATEDVLAIRCMKHREVQPLNSKVLDGSECAVCALEESQFEWQAAIESLEPNAQIAYSGDKKAYVWAVMAKWMERAERESRIAVQLRNRLEELKAGSSSDIDSQASHPAEAQPSSMASERTIALRHAYDRGVKDGEKSMQGSNKVSITEIHP